MRHRRGWHAGCGISMRVALSSGRLVLPRLEKRHSLQRSKSELNGWQIRDCLLKSVDQTGFQKAILQPLLQGQIEWGLRLAETALAIHEDSSLAIRMCKAEFVQNIRLQSVQNCDHVVAAPYTFVNLVSGISWYSGPVQADRRVTDAGECGLNDEVVNGDMFVAEWHDHKTSSRQRRQQSP